MPDGGDGTWEMSDAAQALLERQLNVVLNRSEFYRHKFGLTERSRRWRTEDLARLPWTTRDDLCRDQELTPPYGTRLAVPLERVSRVHRTSGSSGTPLMIALTRRDVADSIRTGARCFQTAGVSPSDVIVHCLNYCLWSGGVTDHLALEKAGAAVIPFGSGHTTDLIRTILNLRPTGIHCTPSYLSLIERRLQEEFRMTPRDLGLAIGLFGGEGGLQDPEFRHRIESTWGLRAIDANYGMADVLSMFAAECPFRGGLHFLADDVLWPELKDPRGDHLLPWTPGTCGELVLTHLRREGQPLIRYRTSDLIEIAGVDSCACGRRGLRFRALGRSDDMIVVRGVNVYLGQIARVIRRALPQAECEYRVLINQRPPVRDCIVQVEMPGSRDRARLVGDLEKRLHAELLLHVQVSALEPGALDRSEGKTQRLQRVLPAA